MALKKSLSKLRQALVKRRLFIYNNRRWVDGFRRTVGGMDLFTITSNCHPFLYSLWRSRMLWYFVPNTLRSIHKNSWRSRLVWSRARDWKSRNRQKRFKSSNLFFSATKMQSYATRRVAFFFSPQPCLHEFAGEKKKTNMRSMVGLRLVAGDLRRKEMFVACNDLRLLLKPCPTSLRGKRKKQTCAAW